MKRKMLVRMGALPQTPFRKLFIKSSLKTLKNFGRRSVFISDVLGKRS